MRSNRKYFEGIKINDDGTTSPTYMGLDVDSEYLYVFTSEKIDGKIIDEIKIPIEYASKFKDDLENKIKELFKIGAKGYCISINKSLILEPYYGDEELPQ